MADTSWSYIYGTTWWSHARFKFTAQHDGTSLGLNFDTLWRTRPSFKFAAQHGGRVRGLHLLHNMDSVLESVFEESKYLTDNKWLLILEPVRTLLVLFC